MYLVLFGHGVGGGGQLDDAHQLLEQTGGHLVFLGVLLGHGVGSGGQLDDVHQLLEQTGGQTAVHHHLHTKIGSWSVSNRSIIW